VKSKDDKVVYGIYAEEERRRRSRNHAIAVKKGGYFTVSERKIVKRALIIFTVAVGCVLFAAWFLIYGCQSDWCRIAPVNVKPVFGPAPEDIAKLLPEAGFDERGTLPSAENDTNFPFILPAGFRISIFAKDLPGARVMRFDSKGNMWVSLTSEGKVVQLMMSEKGIAKKEVFTNLRKPHGLAFDHRDPDVLYVAEDDKVFRVRLPDTNQREKILDLPCCDGHYTRTIGFGPDDKLYISTGSSCNVCVETDGRRSTIIQYDTESKQSKIYARGLRNSVFFTWDYVFGDMVATEMGRDLLGDDLPPDEINLIKENAPLMEVGARDYGWPYCYGQNVPDPFGKDIPGSLCIGKEPAFIDVPAHSAPLGLAFVSEDPPGGGWPEEYWHDLIVAYHGSWNRSVPAGYKVVRHKLTPRQEKGYIYEGVEDFITGFLVDAQSPPDLSRGYPINVGSAYGRPVDIVIQPGGVMYLSDDKAGVIYKIEYTAGQ